MEEFQPEPVANNSVPTWDLVIEDYRSRPEHFFTEDIIEEMKRRDKIGIERYKIPLQPFNGRDSLKDALEEGLDFLAYLKNAIQEGRDVDNNLSDVYWQLFDLVEIVKMLMVDKEE